MIERSCDDCDLEFSAVAFRDCMRNSQRVPVPPRSFADNTRLRPEENSLATGQWRVFWEYFLCGLVGDWPRRRHYLKNLNTPKIHLFYDFISAF